jgi:hypothetical protein
MLMTVRFSNALVAEAIQPFWAALRAGEFLTDASAVAGIHRHRGLAWLREAGGVRPRRGRDLKGRCLSFVEREEIALGRAAGATIRAIAARLGRSPSTVSRELTRNAGGAGRYRATTAHALAYARASRPKPAKLATNLVLRAKGRAGSPQALLTAADRRQVAPRVFRRRGDAGVDRNDLPIAVRAVPGRCDATSRAVCAPAARSAGRAARRGSARTASRT